jgi:hypothetical protein
MNMKQIRTVVVTMVAALCAAAAAHAQDGLDIALKHGSPREARTKAQLQRLLKTYDVSRWISTRSILVDEQASRTVIRYIAAVVSKHELNPAAAVSTRTEFFVPSCFRGGRCSRTEVR